MSKPFRLTERMKPEHELQADVARLLWRLLPDEVFRTAIDHAHKKDALTGAILKARGAVPGLPDLWLVHRGQLHCIELKTEIGRLSETQVDCHAALWRAGAKVAVCRRKEGVLDTLQEWGLPLRGRIAA